MRTVIVLCLIFGGCALGFHANPTDQGMRVEAGFYPTEAAGDFGAKLEDAGTRRKYAEACDKAKEPAACLFALSVGANPEAARAAYYYGRQVCWGSGVCRPFVGSAPGFAPVGATYDVGAVRGEYRRVAALFSSGPDIVRPRPAYLEPEPVDEPPAVRGGTGGGGVARSGDASVTAPRASSLPRRPRASAPPVRAEQAACADYQRTDWERYLQIYKDLMGREGALDKADVAKARDLFDRAERILRRGLDVCQDSAAYLRVIREHRTNLNELREQAGLKDQET